MRQLHRIIQILGINEGRGQFLDLYPSLGHQKVLKIQRLNSEEISIKTITKVKFLFLF